MSADGRQVVDRARDEAESYRETYGHRIPPSALAGRLGLYVHYFTLHGSLRPFGCSVLIACFDEETRNHELYAIDPSGTTLRFFGIAVGKGTQAAKTELEKLPLNEMSCREAMREIARMYVARLGVALLKLSLTAAIGLPAVQCAYDQGPVEGQAFRAGDVVVVRGDELAT